MNVIKFLFSGRESKTEGCCGVQIEEVKEEKVEECCTTDKQEQSACC